MISSILVVVSSSIFEEIKYHFLTALPSLSNALSCHEYLEGLLFSRARVGG